MGGHAETARHLDFPHVGLGFGFSNAVNEYVGWPRFLQLPNTREPLVSGRPSCSWKWTQAAALKRQAARAVIVFDELPIAPVRGG